MYSAWGVDQPAQTRARPGQVGQARFPTKTKTKTKTNTKTSLLSARPGQVGSVFLAHKQVLVTLSEVSQRQRQRHSLRGFSLTLAFKGIVPQCLAVPWQLYRRPCH